MKSARGGATMSVIPTHRRHEPEPAAKWATLQAWVLLLGLCATFLLVASNHFLLSRVPDASVDPIVSYPAAHQVVTLADSTQNDVMDLRVRTSTPRELQSVQGEDAPCNDSAGDDSTQRQSDTVFQEAASSTPWRKGGMLHTVAPPATEVRSDGPTGRTVAEASTPQSRSSGNRKEMSNLRPGDEHAGHSADNGYANDGKESSPANRDGLRAKASALLAADSCIDPAGFSWAAAQVSKQVAYLALVAHIKRCGVWSGTRWNTDGPSLTLHAVRTVNNITTRQFEARHAGQFGLAPLHIKNSQDDWFRPADWSKEAFASILAEHALAESDEDCKEDPTSEDCHHVREFDAALLGKRWAAFKSVNISTLDATSYGEFVGLQEELADQGRYLYVFDKEIHSVPYAFDRLRVPKYFLQEYRFVTSRADTTPEEYSSHLHFPALFFGPTGTSSPLHTDGGMTRFWIMQLAGTKLVRMAPPSENWRLHASDGDDMMPAVYPVDLLAPNFEQHPDLNGALVYEALLQPGDVLFIPEGWPHQALNLDYSAMYSMNYVDHHELEVHMQFQDRDRETVVQGLNAEELRSKRQKYAAFFMPLREASDDDENEPMIKFYENQMLEHAPVSLAAIRYIEALRDRRLSPMQWRDEHGQKLLLVAARRNYLALVKYLIQEGVPMNQVSHEWSALGIADHEGYTRMREYLEELGADNVQPIEVDDS